MVARTLPFVSSLVSQNGTAGSRISRLPCKRTMSATARGHTGWSSPTVQVPNSARGAVAPKTWRAKRSPPPSTSAEVRSTTAISGGVSASPVTTNRLALASSGARIRR